MPTVAETSAFSRWPGLAAWLPLAILPVAAIWLAAAWPAWGFMWAGAISIYAGFKWLSFADSVSRLRPTVEQSLAYLLLWPGMDAKSFFASQRPLDRPHRREWLSAVVKLSVGGLLIGTAVSFADQHPLIAGWIGMAGLAFTLHFGLFHLLSAIWRQQGS